MKSSHALQRLRRHIHAWDYAVLLPWLARLPLPLGYRLANLRELVNAWLRRDWRSTAMQTPYVTENTLHAYQQFQSMLNTRERIKLLGERYRTESRDEFEAALIDAERIPDLHSHFQPSDFPARCKASKGLILLTPHFDSFFLGIVLLSWHGMKINVMTSSITHHPAVDPAVTAHFERKYRGMERFANGGLALDREEGMRGFVRMLQRGECLVILADAPAESPEASLNLNFLGQRCRFTNGFLRLAQIGKAQLGGFVCTYKSPGQYCIEGMLAGEATASNAQQVYDFLSRQIEQQPGLWWGADLLPALIDGDAET